MKLEIRPHSCFSNFFTSNKLYIDATYYSDILYYLQSMQPKFIYYLRQQQAIGVNESYVFLDKNLNIISIDHLKIKKIKDGDIVYIVPAIAGGSGKRGGLLGLLAVAFFVFNPLGALGSGALAGGAEIGTAVSFGMGGGLAGLGKLGGMMQNLVVNAGLSFLSSLFSSSPSDKETRQNDMFGSLTNSTASGTPVALNYGLVRVAGQLVSGYILSNKHGRSDQVNAFGEVITTENNKSTPETEQQARLSELLEGFNQYD